MMNSRTLMLPARSAPAPGRRKPPLIVQVIKPRSTSAVLKPRDDRDGCSKPEQLKREPGLHFQVPLLKPAPAPACRTSTATATATATVRPPAFAVAPKLAKPPKPRQPSPAAEAMRERAEFARMELARRFPACFVPEGAAPKPFAIGIAEQLFDACPDIDRHDLANVLANYTSEPAYYRATVAGTERIDLSGAAVGVVTLAAENHAKPKLRRMAL